MEIEYTPHADFNISERKLNKKIIESIIKNPDKVIDSMYGRKVAQKVVNGKSAEHALSDEEKRALREAKPS